MLAWPVLQTQFNFDDASTEILIKLYQKHDGMWHKIMAEDKMKQIGCFKNDAERKINEIKSNYNIEFINQFKEDTDTKNFLENIKNWKFDVNFVSNSLITS